MHYNPQIDSIFKLGANGAGVLLIHGFTGTPDSMRPVANALNDAGFTVSAPLLEGHGTTVEKCEKSTWKDWLKSAQTAYVELHQKCSKIFICGLSMGALLSLKLAIDYSQSISGIACLATPLTLKGWVHVALPLIRQTSLGRLWRYQKKFGVDIKDPDAKANFWNYDLMPLSCIVSVIELQRVVIRDLSQVRAPVLLIHSRHDNTAPYSSMNEVAHRVSSTVTETVTLENSYHVITLDYDKGLVAEKVCDFFRRFL